MKSKEKIKRFWTLDVHNHKGFTLVELIIVIAILAILSSVAVVGYSSYVKKADKAADDELLRIINQAFRSACIENGVDVDSVTSAFAELNEDGTVKTVYRTTKGDAYSVAFNKYYAGNESSAFKLVTSLVFDRNTHAFVVGSGAYVGLFGKFDANDISAFNGSIFATLGFESLMGKVDLATQIAGAAGEGTTLHGMIFSEANLASLAAYLGYDYNDPDEKAEFDEVFQGLVQQKVNEMIANGADASTEEALDALYMQATTEILSNTAVLVAATNSTFDANAFRAQLIAGTGKDTIKTSVQNEATQQVGLAQAALAYAMYTSYAARNGITASNDMVTVLDALDDPAFMAYMNTPEAEADMYGYLAAMGMINDASGDKTAVSSLLVNGFTDPELLALLQQELGD